MIDESYAMSLCEVRGERDELICVGYLSEIHPQYVVILSKTESIPPVPFRTHLRIEVYSGTQGFHCYTGLSLSTSDNTLFVMQLMELSGSQKRSTFRLAVDVDTVLHRLPVRSKVEDFPVKILDISQGGIRIQTRLQLKERDQFLIHADFLREPLWIACKVVRVIWMEESGDKHQYGCIFSSLLDWQADMVCQFVFKKQAEMYRKTLREL